MHGSEQTFHDKPYRSIFFDIYNVFRMVEIERNLSICTHLLPKIESALKRLLPTAICQSEKYAVIRHIARICAKKY